MPNRDDQAGIIDFVTSPAAFGEPEGTPVERIDTHISVVAMCADRVFKLKRAVQFSFLDFSTPAKRKAACEAEIAVNRRTAPQIYLGVEAITREADGRYAVGGRGEIVDHVVAMRRFDQEGLFDRLAETGRLTPGMIDEAVDAVARLHAGAEIRADQGGAQGMSWIIDDNLKAIAGHAPAIFDDDAVAALSDRTGTAFAAGRDLLEARRVAGKVRHGHGDLHLRNISLIDGKATLFDAIEFSDSLACCDVLYDLAFLIMDLLARDLPDLANRALNRYLWRTGDWQGMPVFRLMLSCRAAVRAKTSAISATAEARDASKDAFATRARTYLALASELLEPVEVELVVVGGLSGSGKSALAIGLAAAIGSPPGAVIVRSDVLRKQLVDTAFDERLPPSAYRGQATGTVYDRLENLAGGLLDGGWPVVGDAVFAAEAERKAIQAVADRRSVPFTGMWLDAPVDELVARVTQRRRDASDADATVVKNQTGYELGSMAWRRIDASGTPARTLARAQRMLTG